VYTFLIYLLTFILVCASIFIVLIVLMQRPSGSAGFGTALGGGAAESAFGGETTKVLMRGTIYGVAVFFMAALLLSMVYVSRKNHATEHGKMPTLTDIARK
jgi:preprotein translocase subunit SecG